MTCECGKPFVRHGWTSETLVGYSNEPGHDHNDNCLKRDYYCEANHLTVVSRRRTCPNCDWKGKLTCFCHSGNKVDVWPDEAGINVAGVSSEP